MPRYLTVQQVKDYVRNEIPTDDDVFIEYACDTAEATLDQACHRRFFVADGSSTRYYKPHLHSSILSIHDCTAVSAVVEDGTPLVANDYQLEPLNALSWAGESVPYTQIRLLDGDTWYSDYHRATIAVTATWGWAAIPTRIRQAALIIAKNVLVKRDEEKTGLVGLADRETEIVNSAITHYARADLGIA